ICKGFPLFLDATNPGAVYVWQDGSTDPFIFAEDPGFYSVTVSSGNCTDSDTIYIDQQEKPLVFLGEDSTLCAGQPLELNAYNYGATYEWQDGSTSATYSPGTSGFYYATAVNQCGISADSINITLLECNCLVYIPNAFSPNRDNKNELFSMQFNCTDFNSELQVYNRMGQLLFSSTDPYAAWDGTYNGQEVPEGVYLYSLKYSGYDSDRQIRKRERGTFLLLR
ncbi:MAG: gliding motility-associated C-terminal domain-containing protein, partial [Methylophilaceae bacterium]